MFSWSMYVVLLKGGLNCKVQVHVCIMHSKYTVLQGSATVWGNRLIYKADGDHDIRSGMFFYGLGQSYSFFRMLFSLDRIKKKEVGRSKPHARNGTYYVRSSGSSLDCWTTPGHTIVGCFN